MNTTIITKNKELKCLWSHIVGSTSVDITTNSLSLFNIIEEISGEIKAPLDDINKEVILPFSYEIISLWQRVAYNNKEIKQTIRIELISPENKELQSFSYDLLIPSDKERMRFRTNINGIKFAGNGEYKILVKIKTKDGFEEMSSTQFNMNIKKAINL
jgi:hypothetical protein